MKWRDWLGWITAAALLLACATKGTVASQLRFVDSDMWENDLIASMKAEQPQITVAFAGTDATMSEMPDRLEKWLFVIDQRDDTTTRFEPDPAFLIPKSPVIGIGITIGLAAWKMYRNWAHYAPSSDYNAIVFYHPSDGYLTRVMFVRKAEPVKSS